MRVDPRVPVALGAVAGFALATGADAAAGLVPGVALAATLATLALGRAGTRAVGVLAALAGLGMVALAVTGSSLGGPVAYGSCGVLVTAGSAWLVARPPRRRPRAARTVSGDVTDPLASWKAMDEGLDPTDEGERP